MTRGYFDGRAAAAAQAHRPLMVAPRQPLYQAPHTYFTGKWAERNALNVPGAFFGAETDTCEEAPYYAPLSAAVDVIGQAFVWRQPRNRRENHALMTAARADPFVGYGWDGDDHWTPALVESWWSERDARMAAYEAVAAAMRKGLPGGKPQDADDFLRYTTSAVEADLAKYVEFLHARRDMTGAS